MKHLEQMILGACYGEGQVKRVSFLEYGDFTIKTHGELFKEIKEHNCIIEAIKKNPQLKSHMVGYSILLGTLNPESFALRLLEYRFQRLLTDLLGQLSQNSNNALEVAILDEAITKIKTVDIFDLSDYLLEYLGHQSSAKTRDRINSFLKYRNERISTAKKVIDEFR